MKDLVTRVELWAEEKGLLSADPIAQFFKVLEESNEIIDAYNKRNIDNLKDGIGDTAVTLIILSKQMNLDIEFDSHSNFIHKDVRVVLLSNINRLGYIADSFAQKIIYEQTFMPDIKTDIALVWFSLVSIANHFGTTIEECLQIAYDEIKNRKGKMIGDTFVKEEDLNVK